MEKWDSLLSFSLNDANYPAQTPLQWLPAIAWGWGCSRAISCLSNEKFEFERCNRMSFLVKEASKHNTEHFRKKLWCLHRTFNTFTCRLMINRETGKLRYSSRCRHLLSVACLRVGNKTASLPPALTVIFTRIRYEQYPTSIFQFPHVRLVHKRIFPWLHFFVYHELYHRHHAAQQLQSVCWISILLIRARASSWVKSSWCSTFGTAHCHMLHILLFY